MPGEYETAIEILKEHGNRGIKLAELSKELSKRDALGFGVNIRAVVYQLGCMERASYDPESDIVSLYKGKLVKGK